MPARFSVELVIVAWTWSTAPPCGQTIPVCAHLGPRSNALQFVWVFFGFLGGVLLFAFCFFDCFGGRVKLSFITLLKNFIIVRV